MESKWFVDENVKNIDKEILLCFPYAGASINMFSMWKEYIDKVIVCPVKLPFRDARRKEKLPESVQKLAEVFVKENIDIMRKRYSIFGHCTGAILGYEIARQTYEKTGNEPTVIIASSSQEPAIIPKEAACEVALAYLNIVFLPIDVEFPVKIVEHCVSAIGLRMILTDTKEHLREF